MDSNLFADVPKVDIISTLVESCEQWIKTNVTKPKSQLHPKKDRQRIRSLDAIAASKRAQTDKRICLWALGWSSKEWAKANRKRKQQGE